MTDEPTAPVADTTPADTTAPETAAPPPVESTLGSGKEDAAPKVTDNPWAEDWRERMAGDDTKAAERLKRYSDPTAVARALTEAQEALRKRDEISFEAKTDEDRAKLRKRLGVPDELDAYHIKPPSDQYDEALFNDFRKTFHDLNLPPVVAQKLVDAYHDKLSANSQQFEQQSYETHQNNLRSIKEKFGHDYNRNVAVYNAFVDQYASDRKAVQSLVLSDGTPLGDHPLFVEMMVNAGLATMPDEALVVAERGAGGNIQTVDAEYRELLDLQFKDPTKYRSADVQKRLETLATIKARRDTGQRR